MISMPVLCHSILWDAIGQVLPVEDEEAGEHDDDRSNDYLGVRNVAEEQKAQGDRPDQQAVLQRRKQ